MSESPPPPVSCGILVAQSLDLCVVFCISLLVLHILGICCLSSWTHSFWLRLMLLLHIIFLHFVNASFNNIPAISYVQVSCIREGNRSTRRKPPTYSKSLTQFITYSCIEYTSPWSGFKCKTLVVIGTDCIGSSNHHTITTTMAHSEILEGRTYVNVFLLLNP
jgi:hypothetical protein